jgi:hypothetical protein
MTPAERETAERDLFGAVSAFQESAYSNFRSTIAFATVFFGGLGVFLIAAGEVNAARVGPAALCVLGGLLGVGYYLTRDRPRVARILLTAAFVGMVLGFASLLVVVQVFGQ